MQEMSRLLEDSLVNRELRAKLARALDLEALVKVAREEGYRVDAEDLVLMLRPRRGDLIGH